MGYPDSRADDAYPRGFPGVCRHAVRPRDCWPKAIVAGGLDVDGHGSERMHRKRGHRRRLDA